MKKNVHPTVLPWRAWLVASLLVGGGLLPTRLSAQEVAAPAPATCDDQFVDLNPANLHQEDFGTYRQSSALFLARLSDLAYESRYSIGQTVDKLRRRYPTEDIVFDFVEDKSTGTQVMLFGTRKFMVMAFRGTEFKRIRDIATDVKVGVHEDAPNTTYNLPAGHGGFRRSLLNLIDDEQIFCRLESFINTCRPGADRTAFPVYLTGHSLGAALAGMFIGPLQKNRYLFGGEYAFAPPLAVTHAEAKKLRADASLHVFDIVNSVDLIPRLGGYSRRNLEHFGKFHRICDDGILTEETEIYKKANFQQKKQLLSYHRLGAYIAALRKPENSSEQVAARKVANKTCF